MIRGDQRRNHQGSGLRRTRRCGAGVEGVRPLPYMVWWWRAAATDAAAAMPPPATTTTPCTVVAARPRRQPHTSSSSAAPTPDDSYVDLRVSRLMHENYRFPTHTRIPIKELATAVDRALTDPIRRKPCLRDAHRMATKENTPFSPRIVDDILRLVDLVRGCYGTPDGARWIRNTLRDAAARRPPPHPASSDSDSSAPGQRRREDPSSGRGNAKRATLPGTSDSDHSRRSEQDRRDRRQVHPRVPTDYDAHPTFQQMSDAISAATMAAVDRHLAHLGLYPRPDSAAVQYSAAAPPHVQYTSAGLAPVASPPQRTSDVDPTTHSSATVQYSAAAPTHVQYTSAGLAPVASPPQRTSDVDPTTHSSATVQYSAAAPTHIQYTSAGLAPVASPPQRTSDVDPTTHSSATVQYSAATPTHVQYTPAGLAPVAPPHRRMGTVDPTTHSSAPVQYSAAVPAPVQYSAPVPARVPSSTAPPPLQHPCEAPAPAVAPPVDAPPAAAPIDERILYDDSSSQISQPSSSSGPRPDFVANIQAAYRTLDMRRVPRVQPLQFPPSADRTAATQLLIRSMRDALSGIFDVTDPTGTVTMHSPVWVPGWHAPLLKLVKAAIIGNRDDTHDLHRLVDDVFAQLQERISSGSSGPDAFKILLADFGDFFDRAPRGAALETLQKFGVRTGTPFSSYLRALRVVVASTVEKGGPLAPSATMAIELVRIRTAQQYPTLMPTLFPGDLATREKPYASLASMWTAFSDLKHNTSPAIDGDAYSSRPHASRSITTPTVTVPAAPAAGSQRYTRLARPPHTVSNVDHVHSRRDPFRIDYGLWPFDDSDYAIVCTVTNQMVNTNLSLWTPLLTDSARRQACIQYSGRCCNCGSSEHSLRWCPAPFTNTFSLLNPEFATHDPDGSKFEIWKDRMRRWRRRGPNRRPQGNGSRPQGNGNSQHNSRGPPPHQQGNSSGLSHATGVAAAPSHPPPPSSAHGPGLASTAPTMRYGPASSGNTHPNARHPGTFQVQPSPTP